MIQYVKKNIVIVCKGKIIMKIQITNDIIRYKIYIIQKLED